MIALLKYGNGSKESVKKHSKTATLQYYVCVLLIKPILPRGLMIVKLQCGILEMGVLNILYRHIIRGFNAFCLYKSTILL